MIPHRLGCRDMSMSSLVRPFSWLTRFLAASLFLGVSLPLCAASFTSSQGATTIPVGSVMTLGGYGTLDGRAVSRDSEMLFATSHQQGSTSDGRGRVRTCLRSRDDLREISSPGSALPVRR